ncbi:PREDICTED: zinc finger CCHC domain-containing protein 7-like [Nestor notabilis]|uniref:zinc finger CCHC domain-containing protein 7-like n=1 Tax=Nestor notabilis TaxID=176057 RepID=UPI0005235C09|nr:PREDICTED: zinc finger CCHC domain-containing protein 7-like [Nestor notabilis]KFQ41277.1 Zinc finger CCHC domain-containing protein 7 [Nestor notabilis]
MFVGYEDAEDTEIYEDELYHEESSSEENIDSEVEFHLYSQIHYSQNLGEISTMEMDEEADVSGVSGVTGHSSVLTEKQCVNKNITESVPCVQVSDDSEVIVLSDTSDEDSVYKSKAMKSRKFLAQGEIHIHPGSSTPYHTKAAGGSTLYPAGSGKDISRQRKSISGKHNPVSSAGAHAIQDVLVIDDSSEEESLASASDNVESWMLLGAGADDRDEHILLNLEDCAAPVSEG